VDKKKRTVRVGLGKQGAFFIDLLWWKQVLKTHKIPLVRWGALDWVGETTSAKRSYFKKDNMNAYRLLSSPDRSDTL
jgi:hypothetical protein